MAPLIRTMVSLTLFCCTIHYFVVGVKELLFELVLVLDLREEDVGGSLYWYCSLMAFLMLVCEFVVGFGFVVHGKKKEGRMRFRSI